ncbi:MAG: DUF362 domain-containing protein [bacterium]
MNMYAAYVDRVDRELKRNLLEALELIGWRESIKKDSVVFVKPNFTFPHYREGITTSPELLKSLLEIIRSRSGNVIVGESNGGNHSFRAEEAFKSHNMYEICTELGVELVNLSSLPSKFVESEIQSKKIRVQLPNMLLEEVDCVISVAVLKVHVMTGVSLGLKNLWGCYPDTMRCLYHQNLDRKLALIAKLLDPKITVVDGLYALNGHGPMFGDPEKTDLLLMSNNVVAADALGAMIMGVPLKKAKHILTAEKEGVGTTDLENIKINTDWTQYGMQFQIRKTLIDRASSLLFHSHIVSKLVMDSPFTPLIYGMAGALRSSEEKAIASQLGTHRSYI